jgi:hypothetical protein
MKIPHLALTTAVLLSFAGCSAPPKTVAVKTAVVPDTIDGTSVSAVRLTVSTDTPMSVEPRLTGPLPGTGPMFSDELGVRFSCPLFRYANGTQLAYHILSPWRGPSTNVTFSVAFPVDQLPVDKREIYLDAQVTVASLAPVPVHVRVK